MAYNFSLLGVSPILEFFNHQQTHHDRSGPGGAAYLGTHHCTLDSFIQSVEEISPQRGWDLDGAVDAVIQYWMRNEIHVRHWQQRLEDAGRESLLVGRIGDIKAMRLEFEALLGQ
jgi:hypothetical protein